MIELIQNLTRTLKDYRLAAAVCLCFCLPAQSGLAADAIYARTTSGIIREIGLEAREAIISGYRYYFGHVQYNNAAEIKLYQSEGGAFELLTVGMKVEIVYAEYGHLRYVLSLQQLSDAALNVEK
jgi:hypothetical protein